VLPEDVKRRQIKVYFERPGIVFPLVLIFLGVIYGAISGLTGSDFGSGPEVRLAEAAAYFLASILIGRSMRWPFDATLWTALSMFFFVLAPSLPTMLAGAFGLEAFGPAAAWWSLALVMIPMLIVVFLLLFLKWRLDPLALAGGLVGVIALPPIWLIFQGLGLSFSWSDAGVLGFSVAILLNLITSLLWLVAARMLAAPRWPRSAAWLAPVLVLGRVIAGLITLLIFVVMSATGVAPGTIGPPIIIVATVLPSLLLLIPTAIAIHYLVRRHSQPSEAQLDDWIEADLPSLVNRAKSLSGLTKFVRAPIELRHFVSEELRGGAFAETRLGTDFEWRYTPQATTVILFTDQQIALYQCAVDLTTGKRISERIYEVFYQSVTDFSWRDQTVTTDYGKLGLAAAVLSQVPGLAHGKANESRRLLRELRRRYKRQIVDHVLQRTWYRSYSLSLENGSSYNIPIFDGRPVGDGSHDSETARRAEDMMAALEAMRAFIREKKRMALAQARPLTANAPLV
jgi:hypothetical protein